MFVSLSSVTFKDFFCLLLKAVQSVVCHICELKFHFLFRTAIENKILCQIRDKRMHCDPVPFDLLVVRHTVHYIESSL